MDHLILISVKYPLLSLITLLIFMASSKALVSTVLLATILLFSLEVNASRELNEQTHNKVSKGPETEEKMSAEIGFSIGDTNGGNTIGGFIPSNRYPGTGYYPGTGFYGGFPGRQFFGGYPGYFGGYPGGYGGYIGNP
ncbi:dormancy-associated protein 2-like [Dioscorea cayenensis subsp. rotundata]|uniref:Dormancy-associated protein 2-like n=1 Tax=Dioscorea cayennensis subsp. rotundata TaxID=55577 RepID=A0AB40AX79_DIOCR|nr:dormancy-associated protein 2-like [Dioscorea cayenensis subsp. rotundata]